MAQDFGDEVGNAIFDFFKRQAEHYFLYGNGNNKMNEWLRRSGKRQGLTDEQAKANAEKLSKRELVTIPFGTEKEASYYAQVCRENEIYATALADKDGNGYLQVAKDDMEQVAKLAPQFRDAMSRLDAQRIADALNQAKALDAKTVESLTEVAEYPELPADDVTLTPVTIRYKDNPNQTFDVLIAEQKLDGLHIPDTVFGDGCSRDDLIHLIDKEIGENYFIVAVGDSYKVHASHEKSDLTEEPKQTQKGRADGETQKPRRKDMDAHCSPEDATKYSNMLRDAASIARDGCTDFADFERLMNEQGYGVTESAKGEVMLYNPATMNDDGTVPPFDRTRDWAISAATLKGNRYKLDITHDWFSENTPKSPTSTTPVREQVKTVDAPAAQRTEQVATNGAMDNDGRTPDPNLGIESHDGMDTNVRTAVMDAEQSGTVVPPSKVREEERVSADDRGYDLASEERDNRAASAQLESESHDPDLDISDKLQPTR